MRWCLDNVNVNVNVQLEYVSRGNLATVLEDNPELSWPGQKFEMCIDIASGMAHLHRFR